MKHDLRRKARELFKEAMDLRGITLSPNVSYIQAQKIQKKQNDCWNKYLFFKNFIEQLEKY